jgi:hypothetical protein
MAAPASLSTLGPVTDNGDGTYTFTGGPYAGQVASVMMGQPYLLQGPGGPTDHSGTILPGGVGGDAHVGQSMGLQQGAGSVIKTGLTAMLPFAGMGIADGMFAGGGQQTMDLPVTDASGNPLPNVDSPNVPNTPNVSSGGGLSPTTESLLGAGLQTGGSLLNGLFSAKAQAAQLKQQQAQAGLQATQLNPYAQQADAAKLALANGLAQNASPASYSAGKLTGGLAGELGNPSTFAGMRAMTSPSALQGGYDQFQQASQIAQGNPAPTGPGTIPGMAAPVNKSIPGAPTSWSQYLAAMMAGQAPPVPGSGG